MFAASQGAQGDSLGVLCLQASPGSAGQAPMCPLSPGSPVPRPRAEIPALTAWPRCILEDAVSGNMS